MQDFEQNRNYEMIKERMKERPINRRKLMRRTIITVSMAVIFGVFACFTFLVLEPVLSNLLYPEPAPEEIYWNRSLITYSVVISTTVFLTRLATL